MVEWSPRVECLLWAEWINQGCWHVPSSSRCLLINTRDCSSTVILPSDKVPKWPLTNTWNPPGELTQQRPLEATCTCFSHVFMFLCFQQSFSQSCQPASSFCLYAYPGLGHAILSGGAASSHFWRGMPKPGCACALEQVSAWFRSNWINCWRWLCAERLKWNCKVLWHPVCGMPVPTDLFSCLTL